MTNALDQLFMAQAIRLANKGLYTTDPNPRVGCVILTAEGKQVGEGWHHRAGQAHAEINALQQAGDQAQGGTAYVSLEPCCHHGKTPPCSQALIEAKLARVVVAMLDPNPLVAGQGIEALQQAGIATEVGLLEEEAQQLNPGFIKRMREAMPYVRLKIAMSLDGRTALATGESKWITGVAARRDVHRLRARSSAILTGIETVLQDNPSLNARLDPAIDLVQPLRVVLDSQLRMPTDATMLSLSGKTLIYTCKRNPDKEHALSQAGAEVHVVAEKNKRTDLLEVLQHLVQAYQVNELMVEAGASLNGAFFQEQVVDELICYIAPSLLGSAARGAMDLPWVATMTDKIQLHNTRVRMVGDDLKLIANLRA